MKVRQIIGWIIGAVIAGLGLLIYLTYYTCRYCAYALWGVAGIIALFLLLDLLGRHANRTAKVMRLIFSTVIGLLFFGAAATGVRITATASAQPEQNCDYLIVLGCAVNGDSPSQMLQYRIDEAYEYLSKNPQTQCIVTGGLGDGDNITEAQCMYNELTSMGIDPSRIWLEEKATSTVENLNYALAILKEKTGGIPEGIGVLSSEFHLFRAQKMANDLGLEVQTIPAKTERKELLLNYFIREIPAVWVYQITGG